MDRRAEDVNGSAARGRGRDIVASVVVSFHPDAAFLERLRAVAEQVDTTVVVDNSTEPDVRDHVKRACLETGAELLSTGENLGVAEALNRGIRAAAKTGATMVLTMDDDSIPLDGMVRELTGTLEDARATGMNVGIVAAASFDGYTGRDSAVAPGADRWKETTVVITSGSLVPVTVFRDVGLFRSDYFIDSVDHEFCLRIKRHGYRVIQANRARMKHHLGSPSTHRILGRTVIPTNHSPVRRFHMARNIIWTTKLFLRSDPAIVLPIVGKLLKHSLLILMIEDRKRQKLGAIASGLVKGLTSRPTPVPRLVR